MFEWWYWFWAWFDAEVSSGRFWEPYLNMGTLFWIVAVVLPIIYLYVVFGGKKVDEDEEPYTLE